MKRSVQRMLSSRAAACARKVRHATRAEADAEVARMLACGDVSPKDRGALGSYHCGGCAGWHVGRSLVGRGRVA